MPKPTEGEPIQIERFIPQRPGKLSEVWHKINSNPDLSIAGVYRPNDAHYNDVGAGTIYIFTAPKQPIFEIEPLNTFMEKLVSGVEGIKISPAKLAENGTYARKNTVMHSGSVSFTEVIGRRTQVVDLSEPEDILNEIGVKPSLINTAPEINDIHRQTYLQVFPHIIIARKAFPTCGPDGEELMYGRITRAVWNDLQNHVSQRLPYHQRLRDVLKMSLGL